MKCFVATDQDHRLRHHRMQRRQVDKIRVSIELKNEQSQFSIPMYSLASSILFFNFTDAPIKALSKNN